MKSVKSVSDLYSPVDGEVTAVNGDLDGDPSLVNAEPYDTWMFKVQLRDGALPSDLLSAGEYDNLTKSAG